MPRLVGSSDTRVAVSQYPGDAITFMLDVASVQATLLKSTETHLVVIVDKPDGSCQQWEIGREESWALGWYNSHQSRITTTVAELMRSSPLAVDDQVRPCRVRASISCASMSCTQLSARPFLRCRRSSSAPSATRTARARRQPLISPRWM